MLIRPNRKIKNLSRRWDMGVLRALCLTLLVVPAVSAQDLRDDFIPGADAMPESIMDADSHEVTIVHAWGITNPAPALYGSSIAPPAKTHCTWDTPKSCWELTNDASSPAPCCTNTVPYGCYDDSCRDCSGNFLGMW